MSTKFSSVGGTVSKRVCFWDSHETYGPTTLSAQYERRRQRFDSPSAFICGSACNYVSLLAQTSSIEEG